MAQQFTKEFIVGQDGFAPEPGSAQKFGVSEIRFPVAVGGQQLPSLQEGADGGQLGQMQFTIDVQFENFISNSEGLSINNNYTVNSVFIDGIVSPCLLDYDGDGIVTQGDIEALYTQYIGMTVQELAPIVGENLAITLDMNMDGTVDTADFETALESVGIAGCVEAPDLSEYPYWASIGGAQSRVAFAYSMRKLREDYNGPCMTVFLDMDKRKLAPRFGIKFWQEEGAMLGILGENISDPSLLGNPQVDAYQEWLDFVAEYPWLEDTIDIPFGDDGYIEYDLIRLMMVDPPRAWDIDMTDEERTTFMRAWEKKPTTSHRLSWRMASAVLVDRWYDQRKDEQRDFISYVRAGNENSANGGRKHPFSKTTFTVGCTMVDKLTKNVTNHNGVFGLGGGLGYGIGLQPWNHAGSDFITPEYNGFSTESNDGILFPGTTNNGLIDQALTLTNDDLSPGWSHWWKYPGDNSVYRFGDVHMRQEKTNAEYANPYFALNDEILIDDSAINSSGERTVVGVSSAANITPALAGIAFGGAVPGNQLGFGPGYSDRRNQVGLNRPISPSQAVKVPAMSSTTPRGDESGEYTDNVVSSGFVSKYDDETKAFVRHRDEYGEFNYYWPAGSTYQEEDMYNTKSPGSNSSYFLGKQQDYFTIGPHNVLGNIMEFIAWNEKKSYEFMRDYISESKEYFTNKKISQ